MNDGPPPDFTRLEDIADDAGINPEEVREWLRREIERRRTLVDAAPNDDSLLALARAVDLRAVPIATTTNGNGSEPSE